MSDIRRPCLTLLLRFQGKTAGNKVELFRADQWDGGCKRKFRIRVRGKWYSYNGKKYFYKTEIFRLLSNSTKI